MSDDRKRPNEWARLFDAWPAPAPPRGFASRVLDACELPPPVQLSIVREPPPRRLGASGLVLCAAIAAVVALLPFALHRRHAPVSAANVVTLGNSFDLGPEHD